jgi:hypothetical protein
MNELKESKSAGLSTNKAWQKGIVHDKFLLASLRLKVLQETYQKRI